VTSGSEGSITFSCFISKLHIFSPFGAKSDRVSSLFGEYFRVKFSQLSKKVFFEIS
jgi:hypothetical protein